MRAIHFPNLFAYQEAMTVAKKINAESDAMVVYYPKIFMGLSLLMLGGLVGIGGWIVNETLGASKWRAQAEVKLNQAITSCGDLQELRLQLTALRSETMSSRTELLGVMQQLTQDSFGRKDWDREQKTLEVRMERLESETRRNAQNIKSILDTLEKSP